MHEIGLIQPSIRPGTSLRATLRRALAHHAWAWRADSARAAEAQESPALSRFPCSSRSWRSCRRHGGN